MGTSNTLLILYKLYMLIPCVLFDSRPPINEDETPIRSAKSFCVSGPILAL